LSTVPIGYVAPYFFRNSGKSFRCSSVEETATIFSPFGPYVRSARSSTSADFWQCGHVVEKNSSTTGLPFNWLSFSTWPFSIFISSSCAGRFTSSANTSPAVSIRITLNSLIDWHLLE